MKRIRLVLADDHALVRAGIRFLLGSFPDMEIVGEASDGQETLQLVKALQPDIVLLDITMPGLNGLDVAARIVEEFSHIRVIILSVHSNEQYVLRALRAGAAGYLLKDGGTAELEMAIRAVSKDQVFLSPAVSKNVILDYLRRIGSQDARLELLTSRQREVLQLVAEGRSTKEIARILSLSQKTVENHRAQLMERIDIHDIAGLVRYAIEAGLIKVDPAK